MSRMASSFLIYSHYFNMYHGISLNFADNFQNNVHTIHALHALLKLYITCTCGVKFTIILAT